MEQLPNWLADAINAAGMATVYNADDWDRLTEKSKPRRMDEAANDPSAASH